MVNPLDSLFTTDPVMILISLAFFFAIVFVGLRKKESPFLLALVNFVMVFTLFVSVGIGSSIFALVLIFGCSFLLTKVITDMFLGQFGESKIMLSYITFFGITIFLINYANMTSSVFSANFPNPDILSTGNCNFGNPNYITIIGQLIFCGFDYITFFGQMLFFSSDIGIVNVVLVLPFTYFIIKYTSDWLRGRGAQ